MGGLACHWVWTGAFEATSGMSVPDDAVSDSDLPLLMGLAAILMGGRANGAQTSGGAGAEERRHRGSHSQAGVIIDSPSVVSSCSGSGNINLLRCCCCGLADAAGKVDDIFYWADALKTEKASTPPRQDFSNHRCRHDPHEECHQRCHCHPHCSHHRSRHGNLTAATTATATATALIILSLEHRCKGILIS